MNVPKGAFGGIGNPPSFDAGTRSNPFIIRIYEFFEL